MLLVGSRETILAGRTELYGALSLSNRLRFSATHDRQAYPKKRMLLRVVRGASDVVLKRHLGRISIRSSLGEITAQMIGLGQYNTPVGAIIVECARRQAQQQQLLSIIEHPIQVGVHTKEGRECGGLNLGRNARNDRTRSCQITLSQRDHGSKLNDGKVC